MQKIHKRCFISLFIALSWSFVVSYAYNPMPMPPFAGRYQVGYDPARRGRPTPPLRKDVIRNKRWKPPAGYVPASRRDQHPNDPPLRRANPSAFRNSTSVEYIEWDNHSDKPGEVSLCSGIWMGNKILYRTCVVFSKPDNTSNI